MFNDKGTCHPIDHQKTIVQRHDDNGHPIILCLQHRAISAEDGSGFEGAQRLEGFAAEDSIKGEDGQGEKAKEVEGAMPAKGGLKIAADERRDDRRRGPDDGKEAGVAFKLFSLERVKKVSPFPYHDDRDGDTMYGTHGEEHIDAMRIGDDEAGQGEEQ